jgi:hypothetical protein
MHFTVNQNFGSTKPTTKAAAAKRVTTFSETIHFLNSINMTTIGTSVQNRGKSQTSSKTLSIQDFKRAWKPRKHQKNDKTNWTKQNRQSRSVGKMFGDKQRMEALKA